jgi:alpha-L-fucosidase
LHDRFGLFIHWGLYSMAARHEWVWKYEEMSEEAYRRYFDRFDPDLYDPDHWARAAASAGMRYVSITTKHHDGFCLWDSKLTDYKATNTPAGRDLLAPMLEAFRRHDLRIGLYHSLPDWHHPDYVIDRIHPLWNHPDREQLDQGRDQRRYIEYLHGQVRELLTQYGRIDSLFFDLGYGLRPGKDLKGAEGWDSLNLLKLVRSLQPHIIVNERLNLLEVEGGWDYRTPEQHLPREGVLVNGQPVPWQTVLTFSGSWGYHRDEATWKSVEQLLQILIEAVSRGGNLMLNVGPTGRGEFDQRALERLQRIGEWMTRHGRSIYGCTRAPSEFKAPDDCRFTYNPDMRRLYCHVFAWPVQVLDLEGMADRVEYAQLLNDGSEIGMETHYHDSRAGGAGKGSGLLTLQLPTRKPDAAIPVIELFLK